MQGKERAELAKKQEENESALRCLREKVLKHEKEQLDLERKRKAMVAEEGLTLRKIARLETLQRRVEEVMMMKDMIIIVLIMMVFNHRHRHIPRW